MARAKNIVGGRVREARADHSHLTQDQLSAKLARDGIGIDRAGISKIENGQRHVTDFELKALAKALAVPSPWLLGER